MNLLDLTPEQLKRAAAIKEEIEALNKQLRTLADGSSRDGAASTKKRSMSPAARGKIAAAQRARWAKRRRT